MPRAARPSTGWPPVGGGWAVDALPGGADPRACRPGSVLDPYPFPVEAVGGRGTVAGTDVRCESPEWTVRWRTGDPPRPNDLHDVPLLCASPGFRSRPASEPTRRTRPAPHPAGVATRVLMYEGYEGLTHDRPREKEVRPVSDSTTAVDASRFGRFRGS